MTEENRVDIDLAVGRVASEAVATTGNNAVVFGLDELSVYYGDFRAVRGVTIDVHEHEITAFIGPSGCGKTTVLRSLNRMNDFIETARVEGKVLYHGVDLYDPAGQRHRGPPSDRDGVPEAEPVPQVDLRQRRVRPAPGGQ